MYRTPKWQGLLIALGLLLLAVALWTGPAPAQHGGHPPEDQAIHEQFYQSWLRPDMRAGDNGVDNALIRNGHSPSDRYASCCSSEDCEPATAVRMRDGHYETQSARNPEWTPIPDKIVEQSYNDARESPDGRTHVCINRTTGVALCFTLGAGT